MRHVWLRGDCTKICAPMITAALLALPVHDAAGEDLLGLYLGGAVGRAQVVSIDVGTDAYPIRFGPYPEFKEYHSAFKVMAGVRPISLVGAELAYINFGHPSGSLFGYPADASIKGAAAFGVLFLPVPVVDIYAKAGLARLQSTLNTVVPGLPICGGCQPPRIELDRTNTGLAAGAGAQYKFRSWAVRAEYEHFNSGGGNPSLLSIGFTWVFL
jgi:Outer membrane protein beta-barrel domain